MNRPILITYFIGLASGSACFAVFFVTFIAGANDYFLAATIGTVCLLILAQLTLVFYRRFLLPGSVAWWHGFIFLLFAIIPSYFLFSGLAEACGAVHCPVILFWTIYLCLVGGIGCLLLLLYRRLLS